MTLYRLLLAFGLALWAETPTHAASTDWVGDAHAAVRLITSIDSLTDDPIIKAGLEFRYASGWHGYWRTPGDAGFAPMIDWSSSENIDSGTIFWPAPVRLVVEELQTSVYLGQFVLPVTLVLKKPGDSARIRISVSYAACLDICVPYQAEFTLTLQPAPGGASAEAPSIAAAWAKVPGTPAAAGIEVVSTRVVEAGSERRLVVELRSRTEPFIRPDLFVEGAGNGIPASPEVGLLEGGRGALLTVRLPKQLRLEKSLTLTLTDGRRTAEFYADNSTGPKPDGW